METHMPTMTRAFTPDVVFDTAGPDPTDPVPVEWIDLGKTFVDTYGRPLTASRKSQLDKMTFDLAKAQVIEVSERADGSYALMDGQGRKYLAQKAGHTHLVAHVHHGLTYEEEAALFVIFNGVRSQVTSVQEFDAAVEAKVPMALAIQTVLAERGLKISEGRGKHTIRVVRVLVEIVNAKDMGLDTLADVLDIVHDAWHDSGDEDQIYAADIMSGMAQFWARYRDDIPSRKKLIDSLRTTRPQRLRMDAAMLTAGPLHPHKYTATGQAILAHYNWKRSTNKLEDWKLGPVKKKAKATAKAA